MRQDKDFIILVVVSLPEFYNEFQMPLYRLIIGFTGEITVHINRSVGFEFQFQHGAHSVQHQGQVHVGPIEFAITKRIKERIVYLELKPVFSLL